MVSIAPTIAEASQDAPIKPGHIYIAPGGEFHLEIAGKTAPKCHLREGPPQSGHRPSVDVLISVSIAFCPAQRGSHFNRYG